MKVPSWQRGEIKVPGWQRKVRTYAEINQSMKMLSLRGAADISLLCGTFKGVHRARTVRRILSRMRRAIYTLVMSPVLVYVARTCNRWLKWYNCREVKTQPFIHFYLHGSGAWQCATVLILLAVPLLVKGRSARVTERRRRGDSREAPGPASDQSSQPWQVQKALLRKIS